MRPHIMIYVWVILGILIGLSILAVLAAVVYFFRVKVSKKNHDELWREIKKMTTSMKDLKKQQKYDRELFDHHFRITDQTIIDTRKEREFWKNKALELKNDDELKN